MEKQKIVKFILEHKTSYLHKGLNYPVDKEDEKFYYFTFNHQTVKYPKFYFMEICQK
jgi:hypothetical protein